MKPYCHFEAKILEHPALSLGKAVDASELMMAVWNRDDPSNGNSLHGYYPQTAPLSAPQSVDINH